MKCDRCGNKDHDVRAKTCRVCGSPVQPETGRASARSSSNYRDVKNWRRHILQRHGAPPVELEEGKTFVLGRSSKCDLKISSPKISRKHTEVFWRDGKPVIRDLGSENGTEVNGKPVREQILEDEDEILVGPFSCTYRCLQGRSSIQLAKELSDSQADTQAMFAVAMTGQLQDMSVYELLETLSYNQKTGTLDLYSGKAAEGTVAMQEGLPLYAAAGALEGDQAIYHVLGWAEGQYRFVAGLDSDLVPNIWTTMQQLLSRAQKLAKSTGKHKQTSTGKHKQTSTGKHPQTSTGKHPQTSTGKHKQPGTHGALPPSGPPKRKGPPPKGKRPPGKRRPPPGPPQGRRPSS